MNPIRGYTMLNFLDWLEKRYPHLTSLRHLNDNELLELVNEFEGGKLKNNQRLTNKWLDGFDFLFRGREDWEGYAFARNKLNLIEIRSNRLFQKFKTMGASLKNHNRQGRDVFERYREVPLHGIFLYTSEDDNIENYILHNWGALDTLSGEYCDIYPSLGQFHNLEDAYDYIENLNVLKRTRFIEYSQLPGLFFWDNSGNTEYIPLEQDSQQSQIKFIVRTIFEAIRKKPVISSITRAKEQLINNEFTDSHENYSNLAKFLDADEIVILKQILTRSELLQTAEERKNFLSLCGLENASNLVQLDKPLNQFSISILAQLTKVHSQTNSSTRLGLFDFLELLSKTDSSYDEKDRSFFEYVINKIENKIELISPQTQGAEWLS
jgi:hypothetical protein